MVTTCKSTRSGVGDASGPLLYKLFIGLRQCNELVIGLSKWTIQLGKPVTQVGYTNWY